MDLLATLRGTPRQGSDLLAESYGETDVMDFGLKPTHWCCPYCLHKLLDWFFELFVPLPPLGSDRGIFSSMSPIVRPVMMQHEQMC